ncbi:DegQ family serine endoprotease [Crenobacter cavernae]|uniref:Probable periplasmic serine endoprotease DegP-like n=1 Tax=Crenobacter cavernae TaxID=2290923 RepID=A0ABY0FGY9_9NEIS|nr:DegQ family serine endoprotease [Crenobacter cavernae]RXZ44281.1 DegQ family serine endoprotease [Crenobacter cavernae]
MPFKKLMLSAVLASLVMTAQVPEAGARDLPDFTQLVQDEGRAVVNISTTQTVRESVPDVPEGLEGFEGDPFFEFFRRFSPPRLKEFQARSLGSGFIVSNDGYVLTNAHVVARADEITVTLNDKREFKAKLIGSDARTDVALLKINADKLPVAKLGSSAKLKVGEWVVAIGSPFGFDSSVTAGIVSAKGRQLPDENYVPFIQTDAAINPGNSGGPLFNLNGEVVGINSQIFSKSGGFMGISFAIPIDVAMNIADQLKRSGRISRGRIGVVVQEVNKDLAASFGLPRAQGALVTNVAKDGPAGKAGLKPGDIVLKIDGQPIDTSSDLQRVISGILPGKAITMDVWRDRAERTVRVVAEEIKEPDPASAGREYRAPGQPEPGQQKMEPIGLMARELNAAQLLQLGVPYGLLVERASGAALRAGIQQGDVIVGVAGKPLTSGEQFRNAVNATRKGGVLAIQIVRRGGTLFVPLKIGDAE